MREWFSFDMTGRQLMKLNDHICCIFAFSFYSRNKKKVPHLLHYKTTSENRAVIYWQYIIDFLWNFLKMVKFIAWFNKYGC